MERRKTDVVERESTEHMEVARRYYCRRYSRDLTRKDLGLHHCTKRIKGRRKGKKCLFLVII